MSTILDAASTAAKAKMQGSNPANLLAPTAAERRRIPMTNQQQKLQVESIPGYHTQWLLGDARVQQALRAGYEFVEEHEVTVNNVLLGGSSLESGSTDLGTRVSVSAGGGSTDGSGQFGRLWLMKQKLEFYNEDAKLLQSRNDSIADTLTAGYKTGILGVGAAGAPTESPVDVQNRYVDASRTKIPDLFRRK